MNKMGEFIVNLIFGVSLGVIPGTLAMASQAPELISTMPASAIEWEAIPEELPDVSSPNLSEPVRTHEVTTDLWQFLWAYPNDPDIPDDVEEACNIYGQMFDVCPEFLMAIADKETGGTFRTDVKSRDGRCWGVMQVNPSVHRDRIAAYGLTKDDLLTADGCVLVAAAYLRELFNEQPDPAVVLMKYNGANTALLNYWRTGRLNYYTRYILRKSEELERKHGKF